MFNCTCADCGKDFRTFDPSWWCDECRKKQFEKRQDKKPQANADSIRAMSDEELAEWLGYTIADTLWEELGKRGASFSRRSGIDAASQLLEWLKQPAEG